MSFIYQKNFAAASAALLQNALTAFALAAGHTSAPAWMSPISGAKPDDALVSNVGIGASREDWGTGGS